MEKTSSMKSSKKNFDTVNNSIKVKRRRDSAKKSNRSASKSHSKTKYNSSYTPLRRSPQKTNNSSIGKMKEGTYSPSTKIKSTSSINRSKDNISTAAKSKELSTLPRSKSKTKSKSGTGEYKPSSHIHEQAVHNLLKEKDTLQVSLHHEKSHMRVIENENEQLKRSLYLVESEVREMKRLKEMLT